MFMEIGILSIIAIGWIWFWNPSRTSRLSLSTQSFQRVAMYRLQSKPWSMFGLGYFTNLVRHSDLGAFIKIRSGRSSPMIRISYPIFLVSRYFRSNIRKFSDIRSEIPEMFHFQEWIYEIFDTPVRSELILRTFPLKKLICYFLDIPGSEYSK